MRPAIAMLLLGLLPFPALAHEFWIEPTEYQVSQSAPVTANIRVGERFKGAAQPYRERTNARFDIVLGAAVVPPESTLGDRPALSRKLPREGLAIIVNETRDSRLTYREWQKFVNFVEHKAFDGALADHAARGLPQTNFVETYRRYAKSLVAVGSGAGADRAVGLDTEIVALANPYTDDMSGGLPVQVLLYGAPRANAQVEVFFRPNGSEQEADVALFTTDAQGRVTIPMTPGTEYMLDAVVLEPREGDVAWHSMWANLTFATPD